MLYLLYEDMLVLSGRIAGDIGITFGQVIHRVSDFDVSEVDFGQEDDNVDEAVAFSVEAFGALLQEFGIISSRGHGVSVDKLMNGLNNHGDTEIVPRFHPL